MLANGTDVVVDVTTRVCRLTGSQRIPRRPDTLGPPAHPRAGPTLTECPEQKGELMYRTSVVVIGAGQAGLAVSHLLTAASVDHVVLERGRVAESWRITSLGLAAPADPELDDPAARLVLPRP